MHMNYEAARINRERVTKLQAKEEAAAKVRDKVHEVDEDSRNTLLTDHYISHFDALVARYRWLGANAEDAVQDAYVKALQYWDNCHPKTPAGVRSWFWVIMQNSAKNAFAKEQRSDMDGSGKIVEQSVGARQETILMAGDILKVVDEYAEPARSVLRATFVDQYTSREIANFLPVTADNARKIVERFRKEVA